MEETNYKYSEDGTLNSEDTRDSLPLISLSIASLLATAGLAVFILIRNTEMLDSLSLSPHLLAGSLFAFGVGVGGFSVLFNLFYAPVMTMRRAAKVGVIYTAYLSLLTIVVDGGTFNPRVALLSVSLLSFWLLIYGIIYAVYSGKLSV